jgi:chitinase
VVNAVDKLRSCFSLLGLLALALGGCAAPGGTPAVAMTSTLAATAVPTEPPTATVEPTLVPTAAPVPEPFRVIGYVTDATVLSTIQFDKLTHINYAFLIPNADGSFAHMANLWKLDELAATADSHGVDVLISVGGWGWDAEFEAMAADPAARALFVEGLAAFVAAHNLDGADIDWEYPDPGVSSENFLALMQALRAALPADKLLTAAVVALGETGGGVPAESFALMDFVNLMAYDGNGPSHASMEYAEAALAYWQGRGLPPEKTVLGVPFYSRPNGVTYRKLVEADPAAAEADEIEYFSGLVNYNGLATMRRKTELALERASGIMIWALDHDTNDETSLLKAIFETVQQDLP